jgi:hypothetical protein
METVRKIPLQFPLEIKSEDGSVSFINEISIGRLKLGHLKLLPPEVFDAAKTGTVDMATLIPALPRIVAGLAHISEELAEQIDFEDLPAAMESLQDFLGGIQGINGEK